MENLHDNAQVLEMLLVKFTENEDVINVDHHKFIEVWPKNVVHCSLKGCRCIGQAKAQGFELIMAKGRSESRFGDIFMWNSDLMIARLKIQTRENLSS